jgi:hypothetical protein
MFLTMKNIPNCSSKVAGLFNKITKLNKFWRKKSKVAKNVDIIGRNFGFFPGPFDLLKIYPSMRKSNTLLFIHF